MEDNENNIEKKYWGSSFYGSRLNTVLLLVLIVLMVFALRFMYKDQSTDFDLPLGQNENIVSN